ncbi:cell envelope biogenesis protein OmpA [Polaribacter sp. Z014]|uniref:cell envelope biogenesis protein OmpA n=1 Tax=Polaribacter sp. Z014 TaxID=2927126 RepID=UPI002021901F|nr:cell envelope biogenesis protein OmpA [Polaribacter sp. Z014]MCL7765230.1 cell envelope biogenesis protein OmpA [Polaribacter sp. Z014]
MKKIPVDNNKDNRFELLRDLLLAEDREKFDSLSQEIIFKEKLTKRISPLVDEKILTLRENFPVEFGDTIIKTIKVQIRDSQDEVVEALYPILGKMVKKFIVAEITKLSDNINRIIKEKFSVKEIIKRFFKGKRNDASIVLEEVFEFIIEEVFVIDKESGLLSGSYSRGNIADKDMISGMLTAIKSFAEDAFSKEGQDLENIKFETFQLSIKNFKTIYIAIATSGVLTEELTEELSDNINNLAETILRDRSYLSEEERLNKLIFSQLIKK